MPEGIGGTQDVAQFSLEIRAAGTERTFRLEVLDYPGGLLESQEGEQWRQLREWIKQADVLLLPVDATLLMEAVTSWHHQRAEELLNLAEIESIAVRQWAKERAASNLSPGLLVLAPVKCESYFADNGGNSDRASALRDRVGRVYGHVLDAVHKESPDVRVMYCPIDTIGCVEVMRVQWPARDDPDGKPNAYYRIRGDAQLRQKGAGDLFVALVDRMLDGARKQQERKADAAARIAELQRHVANTDHGMLTNFWVWINGERRRLLAEADSASANAAGKLAALQAFEQTLDDVRRRPMSTRVNFGMD